MGLLAKTNCFWNAFAVRLTFLCTIESPKIMISRLFYKPREDLVTRMRDHEKLGAYSKLQTL